MTVTKIHSPIYSVYSLGPLVVLQDPRCVVLKLAGICCGAVSGGCIH